MKTTAEKIAVMQAYEEGKTIRIISPMFTHKLNKKKEDIAGTPNWNWGDLDYEVVKEPRTLYVAFRKETGEKWNSSFDKARISKQYPDSMGFEIVEFVEKL